MAQKKWKLTEEDYDIVWFYILQGMKTDKLFRHRDKIFYDMALEDLNDLFRFYGDYYRIPLEAISRWIDRNFDKIQLKRLQVYIRVEKS